MLKNVLQTKDSQILDSGEFLKFKEQFGCKTHVKAENLEHIVIELARQEIIQKSHLMASTWRPTFKELKKKAQFCSIEAITKPNAKKGY